MGVGMWGRRLLLIIEGVVCVGRRVVMVVLMGRKVGLRRGGRGCCLHMGCFAGMGYEMSQQGYNNYCNLPCCLLESCTIIVLHRTLEKLYRHWSLVNPTVFYRL